MSNPNLNIIVEENVPFVRGLLDSYATVRYLAPEDITPKAVRTADALVIRTRTACNEELLAKSDCKLIATATIGTDHIDLPYCCRRGITVVNAPGCNAPAVAQYVFASLLSVINRPLHTLTIGIVGLGHVGSIVESWARGFDMKVLRCDPPRQQAEGGDDWADLNRIAAEADIITFHVPLEREGEHPTYHMVDEAFLAKLRRAPVIVNSSRGAVFDTEAVLAARAAGLTGPLIVDCWENEPHIDRNLLAAAAIATPHIAGYSKEGKIRASQVVMDAVTTLFMLPRVTVDQPLPPAPAGCVSFRDLTESYNPVVDSDALKADPDAFEGLRNHYRLRAEVPEGRNPD